MESLDAPLPEPINRTWSTVVFRYHQCFALRRLLRIIKMAMKYIRINDIAIHFIRTKCRIRAIFQYYPGRRGGLQHTHQPEKPGPSQNLQQRPGGIPESAKSTNLRQSAGRTVVFFRPPFCCRQSRWTKSIFLPMFELIFRGPL